MKTQFATANLIDQTTARFQPLDARLAVVPEPDQACTPARRIFTFEPEFSLHKSFAATRGNATSEKLDDGIRQFKEFMLRTDAEALKKDNVISQETIDQAVAHFRDFCFLVNSLIGDSAEENISVKAELGAKLQREILPYLLLTGTAERFYSKPRGYAGDFFTIELIYENVPRGTGRIGAMLDKCFLESSPSKAVRNRRSLLADEIQLVIKENQGRATSVTSLACGPAQELFDVFDQLEDTRQLKASCLDIDMQALAFVSEKRDKHRLQNRIRLIEANLVYLALGRHKLDLSDQDLIYSTGLIDYFNDELVVKLLNWIYDQLRPGGKVIVGNIHTPNSWKAIMDYLLDWKLIYRNEEDMDRLFSNSAFGRPPTRIRFEEEKMNLFAECIRSSP